MLETETEEVYVEGTGKCGESNPCSRRWVLSYVSFLGFVILYATRVNIAVAIICMVRSGVSNSTLVEDGLSNHTNSTTVLDPVDEACGGLEESITNLQRGEFDWDKPTQSRVLAMYFYGYIFTQIPGGWLAGRFGGKRVWGLGMFVNGLGTLLTPVCARVHINLLYAVRFIIGFAAGVSFPATHAMWGRWAPRLETSKLMALCYSGPHVGTVVAFALSGILCAKGFDNGWGSIFYTFGAANMVWLGLWMLLSADSPREHRFISQSEIMYIERNVEGHNDLTPKSTPWLAMVKSGPLWAIIIAHMCNNWTNYTLITVLPTFMKEVLKYDIKQNGFISSIPYVCHAIFSASWGQISDFIRAHTKLSTTFVRKVNQNLAFLTVAATLVGIGFVDCTNRTLAVVLLCLAVGLMGISKAAYLINHVDIAPKYAGVLFGITNTVATIPGMIAPLVAGALTPNKTAEEWRYVMFICAGFLVFGALVYTCLGSGEIQTWNYHGEKNTEPNEDSRSKEYLPINTITVYNRTPELARCTAEKCC